MSYENAQVDLEYTKWLIRSFEFAMNTVDKNKNQFVNSIATINNMLHIRLAKDYEGLFGFHDFNTKDLREQSKLAKYESYKAYEKQCNKICDCFHVNVKPNLLNDSIQNDASFNDKVCTVQNARINAYNTLQNCQKQIIALHMSVYCNTSGNVSDAKNILHDELYIQLNKAFGIYFMFALCGDKDIVKTAKQIAYNRYLSNDMSIMEYLEVDFEHLGSYWTKDEETFRKDINEKFLR